MRIGFDIRPFLKEETGVGVYFRNLLSSLSRIDHSNDYFLFSSSLKDRLPQNKIPPFTKGTFRDFRFPVKTVNFFWYKFGWPRIETFFRTSLDLTHSPTPLVTPTGGKKIVTVHDLFFMDFPQMTRGETKRDFVNRIHSSLFQADGVIAVSQFTKNQLIERFALPEVKVKVIYHGLDQKFRTEILPEEAERMRRRFSLPPAFILFVGAIEPRKNLLNLAEALQIIHDKEERIPLMIVGQKGLDYKRLQRKIKALGLESWVKMVGYLPDDDVQAFYRSASVFVFPSLCEGFGLPLIEAMASGLPVVASGTSAIPEVAKDAALYFRPEEPEDMAEKIMRALRDEDLRKKLREEGKKRSSEFQWRTTASETLNFYTEITERSSR